MPYGKVMVESEDDVHLGNSYVGKPVALKYPWLYNA